MWSTGHSELMRQLLVLAWLGIMKKMAEIDQKVYNPGRHTTIIER